MKEYENTLAKADVAVVFYSPEALKIKRLEALSESQIARAFNRDDLKIFTDPKYFARFLEETKYENVVILLMSSGNYGGLDLEIIKNNIA